MVVDVDKVFPIGQVEGTLIATPIEPREENRVPECFDTRNRDDFLGRELTAVPLGEGLNSQVHGG